MDSPSRRRTLDYPKPETGLAEWTSKIKAMQREVDADEEAEQRRLEEEIRASRLARTRRSIGNNPANLDLSSSPYGRSVQEISPETENYVDREQSQSDAMRKLVGETSTVTPETVRRTFKPLAATAAPGIEKTRSLPTASKPEPMSLAAFMGGRASGPRLNKPAPQQDANDPAQFEQRTHMTAPHPVFGRGGVAMPGLAAKGIPVSSTPPSGSDGDAKAPPVQSWLRERTKSTPGAAVKDASVTSAQNRSANVAGGFTSTYTMSTSSPSSQKPYSPSPPVKPNKPDAYRRPAQESPTRQFTPPPKSPAEAPKSPHTPHNPRVSSVSSSSPITLPSLARPLQPQVRPTSAGPQLPPSNTPSPAFLKPPAQKDPTPSLSRLQGRGFVQSIVKTSSELQAAATGSPGPERPGSAAKKASVLDRWQPAASSSTSMPSSPAHAPVSPRKANTMDAGSKSDVGEDSEPRRPLKSAASLPKMHIPVDEPQKSNIVRADIPSPSIPGVGSSNTLISYIKPNKTGDAPGTDTQSQAPTVMASEYDDVDELGVRSTRAKNDADGLKRRATKVDVPPASGRPLSHLTKDRARRPRKGGHSDGHSDNNLSATRAMTTTETKGAPAIDTKYSSAADLNDKQRQPAAQPIKSPNETRPVALDNPPQRYESPSDQERASNVRRLRDSWADQAPIGVKPIKKPALASSNTPPPPDTRASADYASPPPTPPLTVRSDAKSPPSPSRQTRIPNTGARATVMDVAQALSEKQAHQTSPTSYEASSPSSNRQTRNINLAQEEDALEERQGAAWGGRTITPASIQAERRRSTYEKYSAIMMPPLHEEKTPVASPAGTLSKSSSGVAELTQHNRSDGIAAALSKANDTDHTDRQRHADDTPPSFNIQRLWDTNIFSFKPDPDSRTVSVEVLNIVGNTSTTITTNSHIFHDEEVLAVVHRAKSKSTGLVSTKLWTWRGRKSRVSEMQERRIQDLAKRFGTTPENCNQCCEPAEMLHVLGGMLAVRQGTRALWSAENTTMHVIRSRSAFLFMDEVDLNVRNLCSGFSYCLSVLDTLWVWYGRGSNDSERRAAMSYSSMLTGGVKTVIEVEEGSEDDMFWMFLGAEGYASADYWKWKRSRLTGTSEPRIWRINYRDSQPIKEVPALSAVESTQVDAVFVLSLCCEVFALVGPGARHLRTDIKLSLDFAQGISSYTKESRPFEPPVHVVILPSRLPLDLCAAIRDLHEDAINGMDIPDHMNILTVREALEHLSQTVWKAEDVKDDRMLPLGVGPSSI